MGLNVWQKDSCGNWLTGSFSGMYVWDRSRQFSTDYFTGEKAEDVAGPPFGKYAVSGYCDNIAKKSFVVEYYKGTTALHMPENLSSLPMSLWNFAQEIHTGRICRNGSYVVHIYRLRHKEKKAWVNNSFWSIY